MDHIRQDLDELMGKDRNHPLHVRLRKRDHFDDEQVTKISNIKFNLGLQIQSAIFLPPRFVSQH
jgi:hypothetical protein